ncbi:Fic family protein [Ramlibacter sp.]|uniref:Fic family protein n=1 Tax=Ramlibacter sp. TaxID=1917967 RepID=UPI003D0CBE3E
MPYLGYEYLRQSLGLTALEPARPALVANVTRISIDEAAVKVPAHVAPVAGAPLDHVLFALKHEGVDLAILAQALPRIDAGDMLSALRATPNGSYIRIACWLWEHFTHQQLQALPAVGGPLALLFDPMRYVTGPEVRNTRWRTVFNGLGSLDYCATVERTAGVEAGLASNVLGRAREFLAGLGPELADRALTWAYLSETEGSYAIEREAPTEDKAEAFAALLQQAHERRPLTEEYLVELQNAAITNPLERAVQFRTEQNRLRGPLRGARGITYLPPPPESVPALMRELMQFANAAPARIDPIVAGAISSFGFVFIHPFMDGNGRLSRFLIHHALCMSGELTHGMLLPVSVAMKRNEQQYLDALKSFSAKARDRWSVTWIDEGQYDIRFKADDSIYRYWDATRVVEFGFAMAEQALDVDLRHETDFLMRYDRLYRAADERFDVRGDVLADLVRFCLFQDGRVSARRRKQYKGRVPEALFDFLEKVASAGEETVETLRRSRK